MGAINSEKVKVKQLLSSRYVGSGRPASWDQRVEGVDVVFSATGREIKLFSDMGQSPPQPGWEILLTAEERPGVYRWTLYGL